MIIALVQIKILEESMSTTVMRRNSLEDSVIQALTQYVLQTSTNPKLLPDYDHQLDVLLFRTLEALFFRQISLTSVNGSPVDFLMMLMWLRADGSHQPPSRITHFCAVIQYWIRSTVVQRVRLTAGGYKEYTPFAHRSLDQDDRMISDDGDQDAAGKYVARLPHVNLITTSMLQNFG